MLATFQTLVPSGAGVLLLSVKIDSQYVGNFYDTGRGKEIANVMVNNKCDVIWGRQRYPPGSPGRSA